LHYFDSRVPAQNDLIITLMIRLRRIGLFKKVDIRDYDLVFYLFCQTEDFPERVFQFFVEWDPTSLVHIDEDGELPLHWAARTSIRGFTIVFSHIIRYYPFQKGIRLFFHEANAVGTPFQTACRKHGRTKVMEVVEEILTRYHSEGTPLHIIEALVVAATDEHIHLDCSYFLLRREPDVLVRLLQSGLYNSNDNTINAGGGGSGSNHDDGNDVDDDEDGDGVGSDGNIWNSKNNRAGKRKRKRGGV